MFETLPLLGLLFQLTILEDEFSALQGTFDEEGKAVKIERLCQKVIGAGAHRFNGVLNGTVPGKNDNRNSRCFGGNAAQDFFPAHAGHPQIGYHQINLVIQRE